jgi:hypothetical protein
LLDNPYNLCHTTPALNNSALTTIKKGKTMKNTITALFLSMLAASAFAQGIPVSASAVAQDDVSAPTLASDAKDGRRPAPSVSESDCCGVPVSAPYIAVSDCCGVPVSAEAHLMASEVSAPKAAEDSSDSLAMAGLGFGLFGLVGVSKLARRKKADKKPGM